MRVLARALLVFVVVGLSAPAALTGAQQPAQAGPISTEVFADGLDEPVFVTHAGDDRLFVLEKAGVIRIIQNGEVLPEPFLDISHLVASEGYEQGILGLAFDPQYAENGRFWVSYSPLPSGRAFVLARYERSENDPNLADPESATILLDEYHQEQNHYGGMLTFGPDGYLYVSTGDGGGSFDPLENGQDLSTLLGAILRLDVSGDEPYTVPADNPFVGVENARGEIWAYGLRNPWRISFDRETGDLYIADVGQETLEEINVQPAGSPGGQNYGWPIMEGTECTRIEPNCDPSQFTLPVEQYPHTEGNTFIGCSVTGGYVYRGNPESPMYGTYLYGDYCTGTIWGLTQSDNGAWNSTTILQTGLTLSSFGEDVNGELYITDLEGGRVLHLNLGNDSQAPVLTSVNPAVIAAGSAPCTVTVSGVNLGADSTVLWNGEARPTTPSGPNSLSFTIDTNHLAEPGTAQITVGTSAPVTLEIAAGLIEGQAVAETWARTDYPVREGMVSRTWMWGPSGMYCATAEPYVDAPGGTRTVQYFDKSRMEVTNPAADPESIWYVTNGLLVTELITGEMQTGDGTFETREPSTLNVAGDLDDPAGPTYATFGSLLDLEPHPTGSTITQRINRAGNVTADESLAQYAATAGEPIAETGHTVASPFWEFMTSTAPVWQNGALVDAPLFENAFYATGLPISEAYWTTVRVAGAEQNVLIQAFERRVLTYTPGNDPGWQVEFGNVGMHYYLWRYGE